ncbi:MAG TPA: twin-arginine translocation signal domain-containing protein, partial [Candidatus Angelobacter sp.]|nr:twin-arginine translocation signal domain-containing protein [Candidatus Angelobacter sp.]
MKKSNEPTLSATNPASSARDNAPDNGASATSSSSSRRDFLKTAGAGAVVLTAGSVLPSTLTPKAEAAEVGPSSAPVQRGNELEKIRKNAAKAARQSVINAFPHPTNGDEERYRDQGFAGNFSKTLPHDPATGLVIPSAYLALVNALEQGTQEAFDAVPAGGRGQLAGPLSPLQFQMAGSDSPDATSP